MEPDPPIHLKQAILASAREANRGQAETSFAWERGDYCLTAITIRLVFVPPRLLFTPQQFAVLVNVC